MFSVLLSPSPRLLSSKFCFQFLARERESEREKKFRFRHVRGRVSPPRSGTRSSWVGEMTAKVRDRKMARKEDGNVSFLAIRLCFPFPSPRLVFRFLARRAARARRISFVLSEAELFPPSFLLLLRPSPSPIEGHRKGSVKKGTAGILRCDCSTEAKDNQQRERERGEKKKTFIFLLLHLFFLLLLFFLLHLLFRFFSLLVAQTKAKPKTRAVRFRAESLQKGDFSLDLIGAARRGAGEKKRERRKRLFSLSFIFVSPSPLFHLFFRFSSLLVVQTKAKPKTDAFSS